jgi:hypothetical protein
MSTKSIAKRKKTYNLFRDFSGKQFTHLLDYYITQTGLEERPVLTDASRNLNIGSFIKTLDDNEDPTVLGYDFIIKYNDSPLFNGAIDEFIKQFAAYGNSEIAARASILEKFKQQFNKYFKNDSPNASNAPSFDGTSGVKSYYLKDIGGLSRLNDQTDNNDSPKQFVEYGKDFITLTLNEDVTQNMAYLAALYKALSYSRETGRQIIPENLLRFDLDLEITEIRKYNRLYRDFTTNKLNVIADQISKQVYTLYECQFFFTEYPHGDKLDMSNPVAVEDYSIKFNFKWSTMKYLKLSFNNQVPQGLSSSSTNSYSEEKIDNFNKNPEEYKSNQTPPEKAIPEEKQKKEEEVKTPQDGKKDGIKKFTSFKKKPETIKSIDLESGGEEQPPKKGGDLEAFATATEEKLNEILPQAKLIEKTLADIQSFVPKPLKGANQPKLLISKDIEKTRNFVGRSVKPLISNFKKNPNS